MNELISDTELVRRMRQGEQVAFAELYRRHQAALYRYALFRCGSAASAADLVQDVFMGLLTGKFVFDALKGQFLNFLFGIVRNLSMKRDAIALRHLSKLPSSDEELDSLENVDEVEIPSDEQGPLERVLTNQMAEDLRLAIAGLAPHYRDVLILFEIQELSYLDIADICEINVGTVRSRLARARAALADKMQTYRSRDLGTIKNC
ncbi:RNA polymerase sigma factor [Undibacterium fentianense]|uniref:RNA polymerase sigma factor n=1 Tax=Undibacterium fentianense TaxID=2828728 RepID=A0A941E5F5_9BURK|nr:RNA polymerase sigma factor [Undibacterium fentianense]MBR7799103.1 RNA polymerase sigma factor [Undibacterium fentianense]